jgi:predicted membrane-bound mannosyltransferase
VTLALLLVGASATLGGAVATSYVYPADDRNPLVQYAQPAGDMKPTLAEIERLSAENEGIDVVFYGEEFYSPNETDTDPRLDIEEGGYPGWFARLPLPWYFEPYDANVTSTKSPADVETYRPPVVITLEESASDIRGNLSDYREVTHQGYLHDRPIVFFIRDS